MSLEKSFEYIHLLGHDKVMIGAALVGAAFHMIGEEVAIAKETKAAVADHPDVVPYHSDDGDAVVLFDVGLLQDAEKVSGRLGPKFAHLGPSYTIKHSPNVQASRDAELKILEQEKGRRVVTVSTSKGGKDRVRVMANSDYQREHGFTTLSSYDSTPFTTKHIRGMGRAMIFGGQLLPNMHSFAKGYARYMEHQHVKHGELFVRGTDLESFYKAQQDMSNLLSDSPDEALIREMLSEQNVGRIITVAAPNDRMVRTDDSHAWLERVVGRHIPYIIDPLRPDGDHAGITDNPDLQLREIERHLAGDFDPILELEEAA